MSDLQVRGPIFGSTGAPSPYTATKSGAIRSSDAHGRYYDATEAGRVFYASGNAGVATPNGLSASSTVMTLYNPANSGVNLALLDISVACTARPAADVAVVLAGNLLVGQAAPTTVTLIGARSGMLGSPCGRALVYSTATLPTVPVAVRPLLAVALAGCNMYSAVDVGGALIVPPTIMVSIQATAAITILPSMTWEEVPILG